MDNLGYYNIYISPFVPLDRLLKREHLTNKWDSCQASIMGGCVVPPIRVYLHRLRLACAETIGVAGAAWFEFAMPFHFKAEMA